MASSVNRVVLWDDATNTPAKVSSTAGSTTDPTITRNAPLAAGTDRSGTATTTASVLAAANTSRRSLTIQNIGANNIGINETGGTAAIGSPGTYTVAPGSTVSVSTNRAISVIAATAATEYTATEV